MHGAVGVIPTPLWIVLFTIAVVIFVYMLFFADKGEGAVTQAMLMGSVVFVMVTLLLLLHFLDNPFRPGVGSTAAGGNGTRDADHRRGTRDRRLRRSRCRATSQASPPEATMADEAPDTPRKRDLVEIFATILLAVAAVATAWSGYQANRWNGEQVKAGSRTNLLRIEAARAQGLSEAETQVDVATFIQWVDAYATDDAVLQDFYVERFRPEFQRSHSTRGSRPTRSTTLTRRSRRSGSRNTRPSRRPMPNASTPKLPHRPRWCSATCNGRRTTCSP